jgi:3-oxoacyl-[acyl-carrier-protein] synthase-3
MARCSIIRGSGCHIPTRAVPNSEFVDGEFYDTAGERFDSPGVEIVRKFEEITGISERRYVDDDQVTSDIAYLAAKSALDSSGVDGETLDYIIVAHNFGDVSAESRQSDFVPSLASRVKEKLRIENPGTVPYDLPFGCPGWLQGMIQADCYLKSGAANRVLVIGAETLSRISDPHDRDSMIYADGAGATIVEATERDDPVGILSHAVRSDTLDHAYLLWMGESSNPAYGNGDRFLKMKGHRLYQYALRTVPPVVRDSLEKAGLTLDDVKKVFLHQANAKMDEAILGRVYRLYGKTDPSPTVMPMTISWLGNSSVATLPTLFDLVVKGKQTDHRVSSNDVVLFASVGAGMNVNAMTYRMP